jgi:hypothetical protein
VVVPVLSYRLHRTTTGTPLSIPVHAPGRFNTSMTTIGRGSHDMVLSKAFTPTQWHQATYHWWHSLAVLWDGHPIYAGPISDKRWNPATKTLTLTTVTPDALLQDRYMFGVGAFGQGDFEVVSKSLRGAIVQAIQRATADDNVEPPFSWRLPFRFHFAGEAGDFTRTWPAKDWATAADIIGTIRKMDGGPDIAFVPFYDEQGNLGWDVFVGSPRIDGPTIDLPLSVRGSRGHTFEVREDGSGMLTGLFTRGEGKGGIRPFGEAGHINDGPPMLVRDAARNVTDIDDQDMLNSMALGLLKEVRTPTRQLDLSLVAGLTANALPVKDLRLGTRFGIRYSGDEYLDPFTSTEYTVALSHDASSDKLFGPEVQTL